MISAGSRVVIPVSFCTQCLCYERQQAERTRTPTQLTKAKVLGFMLLFNIVPVPLLVPENRTAVFKFALRVVGVFFFFHVFTDQEMTDILNGWNGEGRAMFGWHLPRYAMQHFVATLLSPPLNFPYVLFHVLFLAKPWTM